MFAGDALARDQVAAIDATSSLGLVGRSGVKRIGLGVGVAGSGEYAGYFRSVAPPPTMVGASTNLRGGPLTALPSTGTPVNGAGTVMGLLATFPVSAR